MYNLFCVHVLHNNLFTGYVILFNVLVTLFKVRLKAELRNYDRFYPSLSTDTGFSTGSQREFSFVPICMSQKSTLLPVRNSTRGKMMPIS